MAERAARAPADGAPQLDFASILVRESLVSEQEIRRAERISRHLKEPRPIGEILVELGKLSRSDHDRVLRNYRAGLDLLDLLVQDGALSSEDAHAVREALAQDPSRRERDLLVDGGLVTEDRYLAALAAKHDIPLVEPDVAMVDITLLDKVSTRYLWRQEALPLRVEDGKLNVILADPLNRESIHELERIYRMPVSACFASAQKIRRALDTLERLEDGDSQEPDLVLDYEQLDAEPEAEDGRQAVKIVDFLIGKALERQASDIHIEPREGKVEVRLRVDGVLQPLTELPSVFAPRIASRVKILAGADIAERRLHQDGRIHVKLRESKIDIRMSSYASVYGETLVLRLLDRSGGLLPLDKLGFEPRVLRTVRDVVLRESSGITLVTGPTGSGKTTTLYSFTDALIDGRIKVITCEDPVEYVLDGITQCSVNEKTGPTFAESLRAIVRQDPDVVLVGEIRDQVTARLAVEAALTGHKVLSTFHTEDSVAAVVRLLEMGVEPYLVASTLGCVIAQRLVRRLCPDCRKPEDPSSRDLRYLEIDRREAARIGPMAAPGCPACDHTGFRGRVGIHEVLVPSDDLRDAILRRASSRELRQLALQSEVFLSLREDGLLKVSDGITSVSELADRVPRGIAPRDLQTLYETAARRGNG